MLDCREHRKIEEVRVITLLVLDRERLTVVGIYIEKELGIDILFLGEVLTVDTPGTIIP